MSHLKASHCRHTSEGAQVMNEFIYKVEVLCDWLLRVEHEGIMQYFLKWFKHMKNKGMSVCAFVIVWSTLCTVESALSCILPVCRRSSSASDYSFSEEPIIGGFRTGTVTQVPKHCGAVQGTSPVKAEGVAIHLV